MNTEQLISIDEFCIHYKVEFPFVKSLQDFGLIEIIAIEEKPFIHSLHLKELEVIMRLHFELDINLEGIDAINHLLQRINDMQKKISLLENRLRQYDAIG
jgi:hypothetical protein